MEQPHSDYAHIRESVERLGLIARGGFHPGPDDAVPPLADGSPARSVVLVGNTGGALWPVFSASTEANDGQPDPLDRWSRRVIGEIAGGVGGSACFPGDGPPWRPFVAWARRAEPVVESPIGLLVHPDYGLLHAYRGAILLAHEIALPAPDRRRPPCETCPDQPCRSACPVGAFGRSGYDVAACADFLSSGVGARCGDGCLARRACPVGRDCNYPRAQHALHLDAFLVGRGRRARFRAGVDSGSASG